MTITIELTGSEHPLFEPILPEYNPNHIRLFQMVTSSRGKMALPPKLTDYTIELLEGVPQELLENISIMNTLGRFDCTRKPSATAAQVLNEAITKNEERIVKPLIEQVTDSELGQALGLACIEGNLTIVRLLLGQDRISPVHLGEGFQMACDLGFDSIVTELKYPPKLMQRDIDIGYCKAYLASQIPEFHDRRIVVMEVIGERVSSWGIGMVFIQACKDSRQDMAKRLVQNRRLKIAHLHRGLRAAERKGFAPELKSFLSTTSRAELYFYNNRERFLNLGLYTGSAIAAGIALYQGVFSSMPSAPSLLPFLRMVDNRNSFFAADRCCRQITQFQ